MYLTPAVVRATLASIAGRSAKGSTLIVNYHTTMRGALMRLVLRVMGEPVRSKWSAQEIGEALRAVGFSVAEHSGVEDWAKRFATGTVKTGPGRVMWIVVAQRDG